MNAILNNPNPGQPHKVKESKFRRLTRHALSETPLFNGVEIDSILESAESERLEKYKEKYSSDSKEVEAINIISMIYGESTKEDYDSTRMESLAMTLKELIKISN